MGGRADERMRAGGSEMGSCRCPSLSGRIHEDERYRRSGAIRHGGWRPDEREFGAWSARLRFA